MRSKGRVVDYDPEGNAIARMYEEGDDIIIENSQITDDLTELTKAQFNATDERARYGNNMLHRVARIPLVILQDLQRRGILDDEKRFRRWLDDSDNRVWRTRPGKLSK